MLAAGAWGLLAAACNQPRTGGLQVQDLQTGTGAVAQPGSPLSVHYTGWLPDGTKFDSSRERNQPLEFVLGQGMVISGWDRGLVGMRAGGTRRLTVPPALAYGDRGAGPAIKPGATLVFEVQLLAVREPTPAAAP